MQWGGLLEASHDGPGGGITVPAPIHQLLYSSVLSTQRLKAAVKGQWKIISEFNLEMW